MNAVAFAPLDAEVERLQQLARLRLLEGISLSFVANEANEARTKFNKLALEANELRQMLDLPPRLAVFAGWPK